MEWLHHQLRAEDRERERQYLESLGPVGRVFDSHWKFVLLLCVIWPVGFVIGIGIGILL